MRTCAVVPVRVKNDTGFRWRWQTLDGKTHSEHCFQLFHDCREAAEREGYEVDVRRSVALSRETEVVPAGEYKIHG